MKLKYLLPAAAGLMALLSPAVAYAGPAYPGIVTMTNPDGTTVDVRIHGDEFFSYYTDAENNKILSPDADGFWRQAKAEGKLLTVDGGGIEILRNNMPEPIHKPINNIADASSRPGGPHRLSVDKQDGRSGFPVISGEMKGLVVLLEYADKEFSIPNPKESFEKLCNEKGYSEYGHNGSVRDYFSACSSGKFTPSFEVVGPIKVSRNYAYYCGDGPNSKYDNWGYALNEALTQLDQQGFDFSRFDLDGDDYIDFIYFIYAGYGQADSPDSKAIWPHRGDYRNYTYLLGLKSLVLDGKTFNSYACSNELIYYPPTGFQSPCVGGIGTICHEFSHVLGLPDMYDTNGGSTKTPDTMDVMAGGNYNNKSRTPVLYNAYERWFCRWMELTEGKPGESYTLPTLDSSEAPQAVKLPVYLRGTQTPLNEYFIVEGRRKSGWDAFLDDEGIMVWRVKYAYDQWVNNNVNINNSPRFELLNSSEDGFGWPGYYNQSFVTPDSEYPVKPDASSTDDTFFLTGMTFNKSRGEVSFSYNMTDSFPDCTTLLHPAARFGTEDEPEYEYELTWDPYPGATGYIVKVEQKRGESDWSTYKTENVSTNYWSSGKISMRVWDDTRHRATVTVVEHLPSTRTSNVQEYDLKDLGISAVGSIVEESAPIYGGDGFIVAPESAVVYNMSGMRVDTENLPKGFYIVRDGARSVKVVVK